jgi:nicotinate-nucleotide pyrophosphorylase (carboxylating)
MKKIPAFTKTYVKVSDDYLMAFFRRMLEEDKSIMDVTSAFTPKRKVKAEIVFKEAGYVSGIAELLVLYRMVGVSCRPLKKDGDFVRKGEVVLSLSGDSRNILEVERTSLNVLSRMSGITTLARKYVEALKSVGSKAKVSATRKTTPLFRYFEKRAVCVGGGVPHRMNLADMVLIKDNHLRVFGGVKKALEAARNEGRKIPIEIEVTTLKDALKAAAYGADVVMLDNMSPQDAGKVLAALAKKKLRDNVNIEVSGGVNLDNIRDYGLLDVDLISVGGLTYSASSINLSLEFTKILR